MKKHISLRIIAGIVCLYCVVLGLCLNGSEALVADLLRKFLDYELPENSTLIFAARMVGLYMGFFGLCMGLVAWNPVRNRALLSVAAILLVLRAIQRLAFRGDLENAFGISPEKNWIYVITVLLLAGLFIIFRFVLYRDMKKQHE